MTRLERYAKLVEFAKDGATYQQMADRFALTPQRVGQILAAGPPESNRLRGRPCRNVIDGHICGESSRVLKVWQEDCTERAVRLRKCVSCGHEWYTVEITYERHREER